MLDQRAFYGCEEHAPQMVVDEQELILPLEVIRESQLCQFVKPTNLYLARQRDYLSRQLD
jgi:hypothetical protein